MFVLFLYRYHDIEDAASEIHLLLLENMKLFGMEDKSDSESWLNYVDYVDAIVSDGLLRAVGCRCCH